MVGCAAVACKNNSIFKTSNGAESLSFYRFYRLPRDSKLKRTWLANIKRVYPKEENIRVCHLHFEETVFSKRLEDYYTFITFFQFCLL